MHSTIRLKKDMYIRGWLSESSPYRVDQCVLNDKDCLTSGHQFKFHTKANFWHAQRSNLVKYFSNSLDNSVISADRASRITMPTIGHRGRKEGSERRDTEGRASRDLDHGRKGRRRAATTLWNCVICVPWEEYQQPSSSPSFVFI